MQVELGDQILKVGELLDQFMRESGGRGGGKEENRLNIAWEEAEKTGHLAETFVRYFGASKSNKNHMSPGS